MSDPLRQATAIVYFRALRSLGRFEPILGTKHFLFSPCVCGKRQHMESLPNGIPDPMLEESLGQIITELSGELGTLCQAHFSHWP